MHGKGFIDIDGVAEAVDLIRGSTQTSLTPHLTLLTLTQAPMQGCGQSEASDQLLAEASLYLLRVQENNGAWPNNLCPERVKQKKEGRYGSLPQVQTLNHGVYYMSLTQSWRSDHYDRIHPTWVASQALRDRDYKIEREGDMPFRLATCIPVIHELTPCTGAISRQSCMDGSCQEAARQI